LIPTGIDYLALDDRIVHDRGERHLGQLWLTGAMADGDHLNQPAADIEADGLLPTEERHSRLQSEGGDGRG
jgi:hypothetical protein